MVEILIIILGALILSNLVAEHFKLVGPLVLIVVGALVSFIPHLPRVVVTPELILSVFLPILLFWEALNISLRGIKRALRGIILSGTLMVIFVAVSVGLVGQLVGLSLGTALLIGAAIGPTDATAVSSLGKGISRGQMVVLRAESLINDGTALVVFALALEYAGESQQITAGRALTAFAISFGGATLIGLAVGWLAVRAAAPIENAMVSNLVRILTPFVVYFLAEEIEASGVLAVVVCGLYIAQAGPRFQSTNSRFVGRPFWGMVAYILNNFLFFLVGYVLPELVRNLSSDTLVHALWVTVVLYVVMIAARVIFMEVSIRVIRLLDRRPEQRLRRTTFRARLASDLAGFRGGISLAVALSIPAFLPSGEPFPARDVIVFVTSGIVVLSLVIQGALLPFAVRWQRTNSAADAEAEAQAQDKEIRAAMIDSMRLVYRDFDRIVAQNNISPEVAARTKQEWEDERANWVKASADGIEHKILKDRESSQALRLAIIRETRQNMIKFRDEGKIDDESLIYLLEMTDMDEIRITGQVEME